ncbi:unnamed protein product [Acanthocheilonema viteae]|uniref:Uncharacterized protein n=1 Tax=Acanthocheilonema viteae TaxID=6277 RepID=A0A498S731_ACAVI|nr:unnamed protein product [Acanthocheilonema viteae]
MKRQCCAAAVRHKATVRLLHVKLYRYKGNCPFCFPILLLHLLVSCHLLLMSRCNTNGVAEISGYPPWHSDIYVAEELIGTELVAAFIIRLACMPERGKGGDDADSL